MNKTIYDISNILIIGCGGAGLRAAIEAKMNNLSVKVLGKRPKNDAHTTLAAGGINAALANLDEEDSWLEHFADTYLEGYEIGDPDLIEYMAKNSPEHVLEIDNWGANFSKLSDGKLNQRYFGAHKYRRTCFSGDYTGQSILKALLNKVEELDIEINDSEYVTDLLIEEETCFGALSFNIKSGLKTTYLADAVILCTGGHTRIWSKSSSRKYENNGDGLYLAFKAGCSLIDMEMVQFHPTGMITPEEIAGTLVTEAVRGEGGILLNNEGERFMKRYDPKRLELSTRDRVAFANYTEISNSRCSPNGGVYLDITHKGKDFIITKIPKIYKQFIEYQMLDISKEPMEVAPTAHYSMGGVCVDAVEHSTQIKGLYAAGEVAGGLHGANRLGGNSLAEILIFGKAAGRAASNYSKNLNICVRSPNAIKNAIDNLNNRIKKGDQLAFPLQVKLRQVMWDYCGVVRDETKLKKGLDEVNNIKRLLKNVEVIVSDGNYQDLVNIYDLEASIFSAETTILSSLKRKESRGSHQRSDFKNLKRTCRFNTLIKNKNGSLICDQKPCKEIKSDLFEKISSKDKDLDMKNRLLE